MFFSVPQETNNAIIYSSLTVAVEGHRTKFTHSCIQMKPFDWHNYVTDSSQASLELFPCCKVLRKAQKLPSDIFDIKK